MASRKYSRILEAAKYYSAIDNYIQYITDASKRGQRVGQGDPRPPSIKLYVTPFNVELATDQVAQSSAAEPSWTTYGSRFSSFTTATAPADAANVLRLRGYSAARAVIVTGRSGTGTVKTSAVTGLKYLDYGGKSTSIPFGKQAASDDQQVVFDTIKNQVQAGFAGAIVSLRGERF